VFFVLLLFIFFPSRLFHPSYHIFLSLPSALRLSLPLLFSLLEVASNFLSEFHSCLPPINQIFHPQKAVALSLTTTTPFTLLPTLIQTQHPQTSPAPLMT
jgi:hypothetical protein